jgi:hypothetical protein
MSKGFRTTVLPKSVAIALPALLCSCAINCSADNLSGNGQWESWSAGQATPQISWCTARSAGCVVTTPKGAIDYYETSNGNLAPPTNMSFLGSAQLMDLSFSFNSAALGPGTDKVGLYVETQAGTIASMRPLFSTAEQNSNILVAVSSGLQYGFYVENVQRQGTRKETDKYYFMNASLNRSNTGALSADQHFAIYNSLSTDTYFIGIENPSLSSPNMVFTSMLLRARYPAAVPPPPQAPEPAGATLASIGLAAMALLWVRKLVGYQQHAIKIRVCASSLTEVAKTVFRTTG